MLEEGARDRSMRDLGRDSSGCRIPQTAFCPLVAVLRAGSPSSVSAACDSSRTLCLQASCAPEPCPVPRPLSALSLPCCAPCIHVRSTVNKNVGQNLRDNRAHMYVSLNHACAIVHVGTARSREHYTSNTLGPGTRTAPILYGTVTSDNRERKTEATVLHPGSARKSALLPRTPRPVFCLLLLARPMVHEQVRRLMVKISEK